MEESGVFTKLTMELTLNERKSLLQKLQNQSNISKDPLYIEQNLETPVMELERQYERLPWYQHVWLAILSFIKSKPPFKMFQEREVAKVGRLIEAEAPGLFDYNRELLLPEFFRQLTSLKESSRFFYSALDASVNRDRGNFYAFLGSLEMEEIHSRLTNETNPAYILQQEPEIDSQEIRPRGLRSMEDILSLITDAEKDKMYANARSLHCLKQLSSFLFDRILMSFNQNAGTTCSVLLVKDLLISLNNILYSIKEIPSMPLLESLFVFILQDHVADSGFDLYAETHKLLAKAEEAVTNIREFNKLVPLTQILRCATKNPSLLPKDLSGGEDWFTVYREYWRQHIDNQHTEYLRARRYHDLLNSFKYFLKGTNLKLLSNTLSEMNPDGINVKGSFSLSFLQTFYAVVFMGDIYPFLRPILIDGEFFRRENRVEFTESYNELIKIEDEIKRFEEAISPTGDFGKRYVQAREEISSLPIKRRKIQVITEESSEEALRIIERSKVALASMTNVIRGILKLDQGGKYDTLANLSQLAGKNAAAFLEGLKEAMAQFQKTQKILDDIDVMESGF